MVTTLKLSIQFEEPNEGFTLEQFDSLLTNALQDLHGQVGAAIAIDVLQYQPLTAQEYTALIALPDKELIKVWSSLTLLGAYKSNSFQNKTLRGEPEQASSSCSCK